MNKKSVCLIVYSFAEYGGVNAVTASLANELAKKYDVSLLSLVHSSKAYSLDNEVVYHSILNEPHSLTKDALLLLKPTCAYLRSNKFNVVILMGHYPGFLVSVLKPFCKAKFVFSDHGALINQWNDIRARFMRWFASLLCNRTITLAEQSVLDYKKKFNVPKKKLDCIYNWIDLNIPHSTEYSIQSKRIISAGRFGKEKGFDMLVKAFVPVAKKHPDWHLDIYGDGEMMETVRTLIDELELNDNIHLMGMCTNLAERYRDYAMYVLPSYREGMPLVLLEAKANRLPIISFDIMTGPREIVRDGIDGILVKPYDLDKMGNSIIKLIENDELRLNMSEKSQENINKFSKQTILNSWSELIENLK